MLGVTRKRAQAHANLQIQPAPLLIGSTIKIPVFSVPDLTRCMRDEYTPEDLVAEDVPSMLQTLKEQGYRLAVISNRRNPFDEQLASLGLNTYFEYSLAAGTINTWKPDPKIFQHALFEMGVEPESALYVGDNYFADVIGAQSAGIKAVLIDPINLFPEANCLVIERLTELDSVLAD